MNAPRLVLASTLAVLAGSAAAEAVLPMPASPLYVSECGSCHTAYAPGYLPARSWQSLMGDLGRHFGDDASMKDSERELLTAQLQALALDSAHANPTIAARNGGGWAAGAPQRISTSPFFRHMHDEVPNSIWQRQRIVSKANCGACHPHANVGRYSEGEIRIPK